MEGHLIILGLLILLWTLGFGVQRLFRLWTRRRGPQGPGIAAALVVGGIVLAALILFLPQPVRVPAGSGVAGTVGTALGGGIGRAVSGFILMLGLGLAAVLGVAMALGIRAGTPRQDAAPPLDRRAPPR